MPDARQGHDGGAGGRGARRSGAFAGVVVGLALGCGATAAGGQEVRVVTFDAAVDLVLEGNTALLRARADADYLGAVETREWMDFLPEVTVSTRGRRSFGRSFSQEEGAILSESNDVLDAGVSATVDLFSGGERMASIRGAALRREAGRLALERTEEDVLFRVVEGFTTLVMDRELARVRAEELAAAEGLLEQVRRLVDLGRQPASDLYQQQAAQAEAEAALVEAQREVELVETSLIGLLALDPEATYEFRAPAFPALDSPADYDLEDLLARAFARRPDLRARERSLEASGEGVKAARSGYWPSLRLSFDYGSNWSSNSLQPVPGTGADPRTVTFTPDAGGDPVTFTVPGTGSSPELRQPDFFEQLSGRRGGSVSLAVDVPLFDRLRTRAAVAQAEAARLNARYDLQDQRREIALEVRRALLDYRSAAAREAATERRLAAAERAWEAAQRRYDLGAATFVEIAQARSSLVSARSAAVRARFAVLLTRRLIDYHTGGVGIGAVPFIESDEDDHED